ncbi:MAG: hypothetical protein JWQ64_1990 [Subtercola sp.]|jgi:hypothetical protein|nr:hypothetical protein [Subtercola sp.]
MTTPSGSPVVRRTNGLAIASLVLSIVSFLFNPFLLISIIGAVVGFLGLRQSRITGSGRLLALFGLWIGVASTVIGLISIILSFNASS